MVWAEKVGVARARFPTTGPGIQVNRNNVMATHFRKCRFEDRGEVADELFWREDPVDDIVARSLATSDTLGLGGGVAS